MSRINWRISCLRLRLVPLGALTPLGVPFYSEALGDFAVRTWHSAQRRFSLRHECGAQLPTTSPSLPFATSWSPVAPTPIVRMARLREVAGSPFPAGLGPVAIAFDPNFNFAYVVDKGSNTISQYSYGTGNGVLTPLSPATISTGLTPVSIALRVGATGTNIGNTTTNPTDYVYVANSGAGTISIYTLTTSTGTSERLRHAHSLTFGQTSALAAR